MDSRDMRMARLLSFWRYGTRSDDMFTLSVELAHVKKECDGLQSERIELLREIGNLRSALDWVMRHGRLTEDGCPDPEWYAEQAPRVARDALEKNDEDIGRNA